MNASSLAAATTVFAALALAPSVIAADADVAQFAPEPGEVTVVAPTPAPAGALVVTPRTAAPMVRVVDTDTDPVAVNPAGAVTVVYIYPTTPQTFVPVALLPSFLMQPGAEPLQIATEVRSSITVPALPSVDISDGSVDLDCTSITGTVFVGPTDPFNLDRNGNGIGCEPAER